MLYKDAMNSRILIKFIRRLIKNRDLKVCFMLNNLRVHHSMPVKEWLEKHNEKIDVFSLPSYSPELNPDGYINQ